MEGLAAILDLFFGCHHRHLSRVFTINRRTYRVCVNCGVEFDYSLEQMSVVRVHRAIDSPGSRGIQVTKSIMAAKAVRESAYSDTSKVSWKIAPIS